MDPPPVFPVLPVPSLPFVVVHLFRLQVPTPVLSPVVPGLMTSVPLVPTSTFSVGPDTPGAGVQVTGPATAAAPDCM